MVQYCMNCRFLIVYMFVINLSWAGGYTIERYNYHNDDFEKKLPREPG